MNDAIARFETRAASYVQGRPGYLPDLADWLEATLGAHPGQHLADIGCGAGQLAALFVERGYDVTGIEPAAAMREAAATRLAGKTAFSIRDGSADATTLPNASVDAIVVGTAFHWFDPASAQAEFSRILKHGGWVLLAANERDPQTTTDRAFADLLAGYHDDALTLMRDLDDCAPAAFLGAGAVRRVFPYALTLNATDFKALALSRSYMPGSADPRRSQAEARLDECFTQYAVDGRIVLGYRIVAWATAQWTRP